MCTIQHGLSYNQEIYFLYGKPESSSKTFRLRYVIFCQKQINFFCILADFLLSSCFCIKSNLRSCIAFNPSPCFAGNSRPLDPATRLAAAEYSGGNPAVFAESANHNFCNIFHLSQEMFICNPISEFYKIRNITVF